MNENVFQTACRLKTSIERIKMKQRSIEDVRKAFAESIIFKKTPDNAFEKIFMEEIPNLGILDDIVDVLKEKYDREIQELQEEFEAL